MSRLRKADATGPHAVDRERESSRSSTWIIDPSLNLLRSDSKTIAPIAAQLLLRDKHS